MSKQRKVQSVIELARYHVGDTAWWVVLRGTHPLPDIKDEDKWMLEHHPKVLYTRGPYDKLWPHNAKLPRLQHRDFEQVVNLLRSKLVVEQFTVCDILRSRDTGEFFYCNSDDEWIPESNLCDTDIAARNELRRVQRMFKKWVDG